MLRRDFLSLTAAALAAPGWADTINRPDFLTAAAQRDNSTWLVGLRANGETCFKIPVPSRGHAAAVHPHRAQMVAFARRPGTFAVVIDCASGTELARLDAAPGRHFYGHGAFTPDGKWMFVTENDIDAGEGRIGVYDVDAGYARVDETPSGGIGPHQIIRLPDDSFAVANGGILTHPDFGRAKLNLPTMRPNLTYLSPMGQIVDQVEPPAAQHQNSIRHIDADAAGRVHIALQWQGNPMTRVPLMASHKRGEALRFHDHPDTVRLRQFAGSIAVSRNGDEVAMTGPKGSHVLFFDAVTGAPRPAQGLPVASGAAAHGDGFVFTIRGGVAIGNSHGMRQVPVPGDWSWDNHLVPVA